MTDSDHSELFALLQTDPFATMTRIRLQALIAACHRGTMRAPITPANLHLFRRYRNDVSASAACMLADADAWAKAQTLEPSPDRSRENLPPVDGDAAEALHDALADLLACFEHVPATEVPGTFGEPRRSRYVAHVRSKARDALQSYRKSFK